MNHPQVDDERFRQFQKAMLTATKKAITRSAAGLLLSDLEEYMRKIGGSVFVLDRDEHVHGENKEFRVRVAVDKQLQFGDITPVDYVNRVLGWG